MQLWRVGVKGIEGRSGHALVWAEDSRTAENLVRPLADEESWSVEQTRPYEGDAHVIMLVTTDD